MEPSASLASVGTTQLAAAGTPPAPSGAVYAWGDDDAGQLANGNVTVKGHNYDEKSPEPADMPAGTLAVSLAAGQSHSLAATTTGSVFAWGFNGNGQLGTGNTNATTLPVPVAMPPGANVASVAAGFKQSYALTSSGQIYAWGLNKDGQLGIGSTKSQSDLPESVNLPSGVTATAIAAGGFHGLAVGSDGNIYSWGLNEDGQLGDGSTTNSDTPIAVTLPTAAVPVAVAAGDLHSLALTSDGTVFAWGDNVSGELGNGSTTESATPVKVQFPPGVTVTAIAAGSYANIPGQPGGDYNLALASTGAVYGWGNNLYGTIGNGTTKNSDVPTLTDLPDGVTATDLIAGGNRAHVLTASGQMYDWGSSENGGNIDLLPQVDALPSGQIPVALFDGPDAEQYLALMVPNAGSVYAWGDDDSGQLGVGSYTDSTHWEASDMPAGTIATALAVGQSDSYVVSSTGRLYAFGSGQDGQLGNGTTMNVTTPVETDMPPGVVATAVAAGWNQALALTSTGAVYAWGLNRYGELGDGTTKNSDVPVIVDFPPGVTITQVAAGAYHSLAVSSTGAVYAWGLNSDGQLGIGTTIDQPTPSLVTLPTGVLAHDVAGGDVDSLMVATSGAVFAWGDNSYGELGDGSTSPSSVPVAVQLPADTVATAVAAGGSSPTAQPPGGQYSLVLTSLGSVYAWGSNALGQLGDNSTVSSSTPVESEVAKGVSMVQIAAGANYAHAQTSTGAIYYWGTQARGKDPQHVPVVSTLPTNEKAVILSCGPDAEQSLTSLLSTG